MENPRSVCR